MWKKNEMIPPAEHGASRHDNIAQGKQSSKADQVWRLLYRISIRTNVSFGVSFRDISLKRKIV